MWKIILLNIIVRHIVNVNGFNIINSNNNVKMLMDHNYYNVLNNSSFYIQNQIHNNSSLLGNILEHNDPHHDTNFYKLFNNTPIRRDIREIDPIFRGNPKTREEMWFQNFNINSTNLQVDQAASLVTLLNKIVRKYVKSCVPIILYDKYVEESDSIILQTFFQVIYKFLLNFILCV